MTEKEGRMEPIRLIIEGLDELVPPSPEEREPKLDGETENRVGGHHLEPEGESGLPEGCPVIPLGREGDLFHYLDDARQLRTLEYHKHSRLGVQSLFGSKIARLYDYWPRLDRDGNVTGWRPEKAAEALMTAASRKGVWNAFERLRGRGAWEGEKGELILHCGDKIWQGQPSAAATTASEGQAEGAWREPGCIGHHVYPAAPAGPRPTSHRVADGENGPAHQLLSLLSTWNWRRGEVDAMSLLGWIGAAMIAGALNWRPLCWITGATATGKSTLHKLLSLLFEGELLSVSDASAAGVWQKLGHATLPVAFDELEAEEDNRRVNQVVKVARQAASGGLILRGGADHQGSEFIARSCFLFSSILVPPLLGQDRSRMAILELGDLKGQTPPLLDPEHLGIIGAQLRRRLLDGWWRFEDVLQRYRSALEQVGHSARGADQFGTLLAAADVLLHNHSPDSDSVEELASKLRAAELAEISDCGRDEEHCAAHLLTSVIDPYRSGARHLVAELIWKAAERGAPDDNPAEANRILGTFGLKVLTNGKEQRLAVANYHQGLAQLYAGTHWAGRSGAQGAWVQSWRRLPGAERTENALWFAGATCRATLVPIKTLIPEGRPPQKPGALCAGEDLREAP